MPAKKQNKKKNKGRRSRGEELKERRAKVAKLRFVQRWRIIEIAGALKVNERTIKRDLAEIRRKLRREANRNLEHEARDIIEDIKLCFDERVKWLWQQFNELEKSKHDSKTIRLKQDILKQIQTEETNLVENLRKLGLTDIQGEEDDLSSILIEVKARRANIVRNNSGTDDADSS